MKHVSFSNRFFGIVAVVFVGFALLSSISCNKKREIKSLTEMLRDEEKWIKAFKTRQNIQEAKGEEGQTHFDPNVFYKYENGLYMQVLDKGGERPVAEKTHIKTRFKGYFFNPDSIQGFDNLSKGHYQNTEFLYVNRYMRGALHYVLLTSAMGNTLNEIMCEGLAFPMSLLGNGARVRLIVPFLIGPEMSYNLGYPMYCLEVRYEFIN